MTTKLQTLYGLKFNPFRPDIPVEALYTTPSVDAFIRRVELGIAGGGYVMVTGEPGTGKSVALRLLAQRLSRMPSWAPSSIPSLAPWISTESLVSFSQCRSSRTTAGVVSRPCAIAGLNTSPRPYAGPS